MRSSTPGIWTYEIRPLEGVNDMLTTSISPTSNAEQVLDIGGSQDLGIPGCQDTSVRPGAAQCALMWAYRVVIVLNQDPPRQLIPRDNAATDEKCANMGLINLSLQRNHFSACPAMRCVVLFLVAISARQLRSCRRDPYRSEHLAFWPFSRLFTILRTRWGPYMATGV